MVTHLKQSPQWIYEKVYCQRGDVENRIKELHDGMQIGRTSCSNFWANTFRVVLTAGGLRADAGDTPPLGSDSLRPGASLDLARTFLEAGRSGRGLGAPHRAAPAAFLPRLRQRSTSCFQFGRSERVTAPPRRPREFLLVNLLPEVSSLLSQFSLGPSYRTQSFFRFNDFFESIAFGS